MAYHKPYDSEKCFLGPWFVYRNLHDDERIAWVVRDPRDASVSLWQHQRHHGGLASTYSLADYIEDFFTVKIINGPPSAWRQYTEGWLKAMGRMPGHIVQTRHEVLRADRETELRRILDELGLPKDSDRIRQIVAQEKGRTRPAYDGSGEQVEAGRTEWPAHFGPVEARLLNDHCGGLMWELGYGKEPEWLELLRKAT
jgi:hypothetical protein